MRPDIEDLRRLMDEMSAQAPANPGRPAQVARRISAARRARLAMGAGAGVAVLAAAGVAVPGLGGTDADRPAGQVSPTGPSKGPRLRPSNAGLPDTYLGMRPLTIEQYTQHSRRMRVEFTPTGPNTGIVVRCGAGFWAVEWKDGGRTGAGQCLPKHGGLGSETITTPTGGYLPPGKRVVLEVALVPDKVAPWPQRTGSKIVPPAPEALDRYLAQSAPGSARWSLGVYSGTCNVVPCHE